MRLKAILISLLLLSNPFEGSYSIVYAEMISDDNSGVSSPIIMADPVVSPNIGTVKVGDIVTVTLTETNGLTGLIVSTVATINGVDVSSSFQDNSDGTYEYSYTLSEGDDDWSTNSLSINLGFQDMGGDEATTTSLSTNTLVGDANSPDITTVSIPDATMKVGDVVTATITVVDDDGDDYTTGSLTGTIGGFSLTSFTRSNSTTYTAEFTIAEGGTDVAAGDNIPLVGVIITDAAGNSNSTFTTPISQTNDLLDANSPDITAVSIPDVAMNVGDIVTATITVVDDDGDDYSSGSITGTIGGFSLNNFTRSNSTTYRAQFTITEGGTDVAAGFDIPLVGVIITDAAGNSNSAFITPISQSGDPIDANNPDITAVSVPDVVMNVGDVVTATITVVDDDGDDYTTGSLTGTIGGFSLTSFTRSNSTTYTAEFTITEGGTDVAAGDDIPVSITITDAAGNSNSTFTTPISQTNDLLDANSPDITAVSIPDVAMNVGDVVAATITVVDDDGDDYSSGSITGTIGGFSLINLSRTDATTYTAEFTIAEGGTDVAAGDNIPLVGVIITDAAGNSNSAFITPISQSGDPIDANSPDIAAVSIPDVAMNVGGVVTATITVVDDDGDDYTTGSLTGTIGGFSLTSFTRSNSTTYTAQFTITESGTDVAAGDDIPVSITITDAAGNSNSTFTTPINQTGDPIDANSPDITAVSVPDVVMNVGDVVTATITVVDDDGDDYTTGSLTGTIGGFSLTSFTRSNSTTYTAEFTITEGGTDVAAGDDIPVSITITDAAGNSNSTFTTPISQTNDLLDANSPDITAVSIPDVAMNVGDVVAATITVVDDDGDDYSSGSITGTIGGFSLSNLSRTDATTYTAQFTITESGTDVAAEDDIPVSITITDAAGNSNSAFITPISQTGDPIDANSPDITTVSVPDVVMNVGDVVTATITVVDDDGDDYTTGSLTGTIGGFSLTSFTRSNSTTYTAQFTITEGGTDVAAGDDIPVSITITDAAGNSNSTFTTPISQSNDLLDANSPDITSVSIPDVAMNVGDIVTATITVVDDDGDDYSSGSITGTIGGFSLSNLSRTDATTYTAEFTITEGGTDVAAGDNIPLVGVFITDAAGNSNSAFITPISQSGDPIDANSPDITAVSIPDVAMNVGDVVTATITVVDDDGDDYTTGSLTGTIGGFSLTSFTRSNSTTYTAQFTITEGGTDVAAGDDIPVSITIMDAAGNSNSTFITPISQSNDLLDANSPKVIEIQLSEELINDNSNEPFVITITFSEPMDQTINPSVSIEDPDSGSTLDMETGSWSNEFVFVQPYTILDTDENIEDLDINISESLDLVGNIQFSRIFEDALDIDTKNPTVTIGPPSENETINGPVEFKVTFQDESGIDRVTLTPNDILLNVTRSADATISIREESNNIFYVELSGIVGVGDVGITIKEGTAFDMAGNISSRTNPSSVFRSRKTLLVRAKDTIFCQFDVLPECLSLDFQGFINEDDAQVLLEQPCAKAETVGLTVGEWPILVNGGQDDYYILTPENGLLTITSTPPVAFVKIKSNRILINADENRFNYQWGFGDTLLEETGGKNYFVSDFELDGEESLYWSRAFNDNGCSRTSFIGDVPDEDDDEQFTLDTTISPNPTDGVQIRIEYQSSFIGIVEISILNQHGMVIRDLGPFSKGEIPFNSGMIQLSSRLNPGLYIVRITDSNGFMTFQRLLVR